MSSRCDLLASVLVDRAYSGKTGNKANGLLGNVSGLNTRVGLADEIHCCTAAANVAWSDKRRNAQGKAKAKSTHLGGSAKSGSAAGSAEAGCEEAADPKSSSCSHGEPSSSDESSSSSSSSSSETGNIRGIVRDCQHQGSRQGPHNSYATECWAGLCWEQRAVECHDGIPGISAGIPEDMAS